MKKIGFLILLIMVFNHAKSQWHSTPILVKFDSMPQPPSPDYSLEKNWAALPTRFDACDKTPEGLPNEQLNADADVFWIHPTTYTKTPDSIYKWNADVRNEKLNQRT